MINTHLKFQGKIPTVQKLLHSKRIAQNFEVSSSNLTLKVKVKSSNPSETFRCTLNSSSWKVKLEGVQCLRVKIRILEV